MPPGEDGDDVVQESPLFQAFQFAVPDGLVGPVGSEGPRNDLFVDFVFDFFGGLLGELLVTVSVVVDSDFC